jgi:hypothetical protein
MGAAAVVDLSSEEAPSILRQACEHSGFAVLKGHGVPQAVIDAMRDAQRRFFAVSCSQARTLAPVDSAGRAHRWLASPLRPQLQLPMGKKMELLATKDPNNRGCEHLLPPCLSILPCLTSCQPQGSGPARPAPPHRRCRRYSPPNEQALDPSGQPDTKEGYYIGRELPAGDLLLQGPNVWPPEEWVPGFSRRARLPACLGVLLPCKWYCGWQVPESITAGPLGIPCKADGPWMVPSRTPLPLPPPHPASFLPPEACCRPATLPQRTLGRPQALQLLEPSRSTPDFPPPTFHPRLSTLQRHAGLPRRHAGPG